MRRLDREVLGDLASRVLFGALFVLLTLNLWADYEKTGRITGLLFVVSEALVVVLMVIRRPALAVDHSVTSAALTAVSLIAPPLLRPGSVPSLVPDIVTVTVATAGVIVVILGKITIGRSFGLVPANRGVVAGGPYRVVRHPIYTGYLVTHAATLVAYPTVWNAVVIVIADAALVLRALAEERVLSADRDYQAYCGRVAWHLVPGVF